ncbi:hypothetical protein EDD52_10842 [Primorskyibacter sedentarius]|uniref:Uncharacterized protein n=1 Tax=Primorskyibacter sedentarius TaxID=745311 RepID=A0A4R3JA35_9RHOB|nr:hypothetical protein [Primorskyibacter sedentarius]TCS62748.1 hypothetical protein EDD52_10842 [Primorskyibacter sedentarius]
MEIIEEQLQPSETDILVDKIFTPGGTHVVERPAKRPTGVIWLLLEPKQITETPPLQELQRLQGLA